jgi:hypothetical protein
LIYVKGGKIIDIDGNPEGSGANSVSSSILS